MGDFTDCNHSTDDRTFSEDDITVVFHKVTNHDDDDDDDAGGDEECGGDERTAERIRLQSNSHVSFDNGNAEEDEAREGSANSAADSERKTLCPPVFCFQSKPTFQGGSALTGSGAPLAGI